MEENEYCYTPTVTEAGLAGYKMINTLSLWRRKLAGLVISSIKWVNLPATVDPVYLERSLYYTGSVIFFEVDEGLVCCKGYGTSKPNIYGIPQNRIVTASNGFTAELSAENSTICYNNVLRTASSRDAIQYASRLAELDQVIDLNIHAQKNPVIIRANKNTELSVRNAYAKYDGNVPVIAVTEDFDPDAMTVLDLKAPFVADKLRVTQMDLLTEFSISQGIASSGNFKAERMIESEVVSNNSGVLVNRQAKLRPRQLCCDYINKHFAHLLEAPVEVKFVEDAADRIFSGEEVAE